MLELSIFLINNKYRSNDFLTNINIIGGENDMKIDTEMKTIKIETEVPNKFVFRCDHCGKELIVLEPYNESEKLFSVSYIDADVNIPNFYLMYILNRLNYTLCNYDFNNHNRSNDNSVTDISLICKDCLNHAIDDYMKKVVMSKINISVIDSSLIIKNPLSEIDENSVIPVEQVESIFDHVYKD